MHIDEIALRVDDEMNYMEYGGKYVIFHGFRKDNKCLFRCTLCEAWAQFRTMAHSILVITLCCVTQVVFRIFVSAAQPFH
jgi:hypothetical protein